MDERAAVVLVADMQQQQQQQGDAQSEQDFAAFAANVQTSFGEFCSSWLVVPAAGHNLTTLEVSVIAVHERGLAVLCDRAELLDVQRSADQLAAVHSALSRLRDVSAVAVAATDQQLCVVQALDVSHRICRDRPATVFVVSSAPRPVNPAARSTLERLQTSLASVKFVAVQAAGAAESLFPTATSDLHCCSSVVIHNDKESWQRVLRAELRDRKLTERCQLSFPGGGQTGAHAVSLVCDLVYMPQSDQIGEAQSLQAAIFGSNINIDGNNVVHVSSVVRLSGVGDDMLSGGMSATVLASMDSVGMDVDRMSTNADLFRAYLRLLKSSGSGLVCYHEQWQDDVSCATRRYFLLQPGERTLLMKRLATGDHIVPLPDISFGESSASIPAAISDMAQQNLASLPSNDVFNPCDYSTGVHHAMASFLQSNRRKPGGASVPVLPRLNCSSMHMVPLSPLSSSVWSHNAAVDRRQGMHLAPGSGAAGASSLLLDSDPIVSDDGEDAPKTYHRMAHVAESPRAPPASQSRGLKIRRITNSAVAPNNR